MRSTIIIDQQITIAATPHAVFAYACDYRNDPQWRSGVRHMSINNYGDVHAGDRTHEVLRVLGRTTRTEAIITAYEPDSNTAFRTIAGDLTASGYRQTQRVGDETVFTYYAEALLDRPLRLLARPIELVFNRRAAKDLRTLAKLLARTPHRLPPGTAAASDRESPARHRLETSNQ